MSDSDHQRAVNAIRAIRPPYFNPRIKVTGFLNTDGTTADNPTANAQTGYLWVHGYPRGSNVQVLYAPAINPYVKDAQVWVGDNHARQAVAFEPVVDKNAVQQWGAGLLALAAPQNAPSLTLVEGRLQASTLGGLYVHVNGFYYEDQYYPGGSGSVTVFDPTAYDFDVSADVPTTIDTARWVRVCFDPSDASLHAAAGAEIYVSGNVWLMNEVDIGLIPVPVGMYPVGAVALVYGQTTLTGAYFASARDLLSPHAVTIFDVMMSADGFPMVDADGYFMIRS